MVEVKSSARGESVARAAFELRNAAEHEPLGEPLLIVPSMGEVGAVICERERVNWVDLHGNASIDTKDLHVYVRGRRDAEIDLRDEVGINPFSKTASRVIHLLLTDPRREWRRAEIEAATGLDKGYLSKVIGALATHGYVEDAPSRRVRTLHVDDPIVLLDAWCEHYKPNRAKLWGLVAARNGRKALQKSVKTLADAGVAHVVGGLGAAAHYTAFGSFRRLDVSIDGELPDGVMEKLHVSANEQGRNVAFHDDLVTASLATSEEDRVSFASPVLTYMQLSHLPERSKEASEELRHYLLAQWA